MGADRPRQRSADARRRPDRLITGSERHERDGQPGVFDETPATGTLPANLLEALASVLERHTDTPDECLFAFWEGFAGMPPVVAGAPAFSVPGRRFHLLTGPLEAVHALTAFPRGQSPNLWWPRDRSWCVATEIDFKTTYIGADRACADQLTSTPGVEAFRVSPDTGIDWLSDALNRRPSTT
ncbi:MAG TPA: hypothetical protein VM299_01250 [Solirubrobacteraceae bacterium]|nr:hypothetical protein [Solirubrobacteraceae bacterium]